MASEDSKASPPTKSVRTRSPNYPSMSLKAAISKAEALWKAIGKHEAHLDSALSVMGYSKKTGPALRSVAALQQFKLLSDSGKSGERKVRLTELAQDILLLTDADPRKSAGIQKAAFSPRIYADLWNRYRSHLPNDDVITAYLVRDKEFNQAAVAGLLTDYRATLELAKPDENANVVVDLEPEDGDDEGETLERETPPIQQHKPHQHSKPPANPASHPSSNRPKMDPNVKYLTLPTDAGDAFIPLGMSAKDFKLFKMAVDLFESKIVTDESGDS